MKHFNITARHPSTLKRYGIRLLLILLVIPEVHYANATIVINGRYIIDRPVTYANVSLDFSHGSFYITNNATVVIENATIHGTISPDNPDLIILSNGNLILKNTRVRINSENIIPQPLKPPQYNVIRLLRGNTQLIDNHFSVDTFYTVGLFTTDNQPTSNLLFRHNQINNFHGGIFAINSSNSTISGNHFQNVSSGNIYTKNGSRFLIEKNTIQFSGNNNVGDSIDVIDSDTIRLSNNDIYSSTCYSIFILRSKNIQVESNRIVGGITYAVYATNAMNVLDSNYPQLVSLENRYFSPEENSDNSNITITNNYLSQNRFGLSVNHTNGLQVKNNIFIQRFADTKSRAFWTNNDILLKDNINIVWSGNIYKEAYTQSMTGKNTSSRKFVIFPLHKGVIL